MQINNIITNKVLRLSNVNGNKATFWTYANDIDTIQNGSVTLDLALTNYIYTQSATQLGADYQTSESTINWLFQNDSRFIRFIIPATVYAYETLQGTNFGLLLKQLVVALKPYVVFNESDVNALIYLQQVLPEHIVIVNPYVIAGAIRVQKLVNGAIVEITDLNNL
jgi:hypothetical protein